MIPDSRCNFWRLPIVFLIPILELYDGSISHSSSCWKPFFANFSSKWVAGFSPSRFFWIFRKVTHCIWIRWIVEICIHWNHEISRAQISLRSNPRGFGFSVFFLAWCISHGRTFPICFRQSATLCPNFVDLILRSIESWRNLSFVFNPRPPLLSLQCYSWSEGHLPESLT